jgi:hypothetical protein
MSVGGDTDVGLEEGGFSLLRLLESLKPWQLLLIAAAAAVVIGVLIGIIMGKYQLKKASGHYKPLLSLKQRLVYLSLFLLGAGCVLFGVFYPFSEAQDPEVGIVDEGVVAPGLAEGGEGVGGVDGGMIDAPIELR